MLKQAQLSLQAQDMQLGYDILGRLLSAAENYYCKCQEKSYDYQKANYGSHDIFHNANKKSKETIRRELINQINIFQTSNQYFLNKYNFGLQPPNIQQVINDIMLWRKSMKNKKDIELYDNIIEILKNNKLINTDNLLMGNENIGLKNVGRQEFWQNIGPHASAATQERIAYINNNENFQPTLYRGAGNNYLYQNKTLMQVDDTMNLSNEADNIILEIFTRLDDYKNQIAKRKIIIQEIKNKLNKLKILLDNIHSKNKAYLFPQSQLKKEHFLQKLKGLIKNGTKDDDHKQIFEECKNLIEMEGEIDFC